MINKTNYEVIKTKVLIFDAYINTHCRGKNGWISYRPEDIPANIEPVSNDERSSVETYEFTQNPPDKYLVYVRRLMVAPGVVGSHIEATTWTGELLGKGILGTMYETKRGQRYPITFKGINNQIYEGIYYYSDGDYAVVKRIK